ncbi:DUF305 domain-containing protein [Aphanothece hegewaldii CCALA 016]|uniref:DUF305 domain-containing protein n=1 Tax=Aphanothece hegewaldii CCALA 016 TaxID=2107694 RepID=A0A2T1LRE8_9CHRO|nr:DUF305 domain-containing protein [Aphanothece hegewaldii]PSF31270.1 DUF305 domain-containing protein [Aphanothece hegewaldii CCALA 016]
MRRLQRKNNFFRITFLVFTATTLGLLTSCSLIQNKTDSHQMSSHGDEMADHSMSMNLGPSDAQFDLRFIDAMILHHEGAVNMAKEALQKSKRPEIQQLAQDIIKAQQKEIAQLQQWRKSWYPDAGEKPVAYSDSMRHTMSMSKKQIKSMRMDMDLGAADAKFDHRFINAMIPHHEGALVMAQEALNDSKRPEIQKLSQEIISSQQKEIEQMKQWRQSWYQAS